MKTSKRTRFQILSLVMLGFLIFCAASAAIRSSHHPNECQADTSTEQAARQQEPPETLWCPSTWLPITTLTSLLVLATAGLWVFTAMLWLATNKAVIGGEDAIVAALKHVAESARAAKAMEDVAASMAKNVSIVKTMSDSQRLFWQKQMRAYLSVNHMGVVPQDRETGWRTEIRLLLINTGHTPADDVAYQAKMDILPFPLPDDFDFPIPDTPRTSTSVLNPGQNIIMAANLPEIVSDEIIQQYVAAVKYRIYIWGIATFNDIMGEPQTVKFCQSVTWMRNGNTFGVNTSRHNQAT